MASPPNLDSVAEEGLPSNNTAPTSPGTAPVVSKTMDVDCGIFGKVKVHVQGDLQELEKKAVFLTVHDIGTNHSSFRDFTEHPCMSEIKSRSIFIHLDLPGQDENCEDLPDDYTFPSIQQMGEQLIPTVLDHLKVKLVIAIGEGAGANVLVRFALTNPSNVLGMILIHLVTAGVGMLEKLKDTFLTGKRRPSEAFQQPEHVIALHKLGGASSPVSGEDKLLTDYRMQVASLNSKNLRKYVEAYMNRKDISDKLANIKPFDVLLVAGAKSPHAQGVVNIYGKLDKSRTSLLKIDNIVDVMAEAPEKLAQSLLLFVKGLGCLTSLSLPGVERQRTFSGEGQAESKSIPPNRAALGAIGRRRTLSMEEYDLPRPRRLSLTTPGSNTSPPK